MDRFKMASALLARAHFHKAWIGNDHGDRYEEAVISGSVPDEMQIVVKEILDHLRAALDYCAQHIWRQFSEKPEGISEKPQKKNIYFPIASKNVKDSDFLSIMNNKMPGVASSYPAVVNAFKSFQVFTDEKNAWLPELGSGLITTK